MCQVWLDYENRNLYNEIFTFHFLISGYLLKLWYGYGVMKNQTPTKRWEYLVFPSLFHWGVRTLWVLMSGGELKIVSFQNCHEIASWTKMEFLTLCQSFWEQQKPNLLTWTSSSQQILWVDDNAIFWVISSTQSFHFDIGLRYHPCIVFFC